MSLSKDLSARIDTKIRHICCRHATHFRAKNTNRTNRLKVRTWRKLFHANENQTKVGVETVKSDKML